MSLITIIHTYMYFVGREVVEGLRGGVARPDGVLSMAEGNARARSHGKARKGKSMYVCMYVCMYGSMNCMYVDHQVYVCI